MRRASQPEGRPPDTESRSGLRACAGKVELATFKKAFEEIDLDGSGRVDPKEVMKFVESCGQEVDSTHFWKLL